MNVVPGFLKREPAVAPLPPPQQDSSGRPKAVVDFLTQTDREREENAWLRSENTQLTIELKVANERIRGLEQELNFVRDERDRLCVHDSTLVSGIHHLKLICTDLEQRARAEAYAPPASGTLETSPTVTPHDEKLLNELTTALAPERADG